MRLRWFVPGRPTAVPRRCWEGKSQTRWITQKHLRRKEEAKQQWAGWAKEIHAGERKSFVDLLEERGLIHQVVGFVSCIYFFFPLPT